jgi:hypothetical protein
MDSGAASQKLPPTLFRAAVDWPSIFSRFNHLFNEIDRAAATGDVGSAEARAILDPVYEFPKVDGWKTAIGAQLSRRVRTDVIYGILGQLQAPFMILFGNEKRHTSYRDLMQIAFALAAFRAAQGDYPDVLGALVPKYLAAVPQDRETQMPLHYEKRGAGYLLYATGPDGVDDGGDGWLGSVVDGEWTNDKVDVSPFNHDYVVRVPVSPVESPGSKQE